MSETTGWRAMNRPQPPQQAGELGDGDHPDRGVQDRGPEDRAGEGVGVGDLDDLLTGERVHDASSSPR